jgi:hypothetical protein
VKKTSSVSDKILKIQKKLCSFEVGSRNYKKYEKILAKHVKKHNMKQRVSSNIKTIEVIKEISEKS